MDGENPHRNNAGNSDESPNDLAEGMDDQHEESEQVHDIPSLIDKDLNNIYKKKKIKHLLLIV